MAQKHLVSKNGNTKAYSTLPTSADIERLLGVKSVAQQQWNEYLIGEIEPYVPMLSGALASTARSEDNFIIYGDGLPYARFLYFGKVMVGRETGSPFARRGETKVLTDRDLKFSGAPMRGAFWDRRWLAANREKAREKKCEIIINTFKDN